MRLSQIIGLVSFGAIASCAHAPQTPTPPPSPEALAPAPKPQLQATSVTPAVDATADLADALRGATVFFDFDRDELKPEGMAALQRVAKVLRKYPAAAIRVEGNCDERGTEEYNLMLGERRAATARAYLVALGVGPQQVDTVSYGALRPANPEHTEEAWTVNRRDELHASR